MHWLSVAPHCYKHLCEALCGLRLGRLPRQRREKRPIFISTPNEKQKYGNLSHKQLEIHIYTEATKLYDNSHQGSTIYTLVVNIHTTQGKKDDRTAGYVIPPPDIREHKNLRTMTRPPRSQVRTHDSWWAQMAQLEPRPAPAPALSSADSHARGPGAAHHCTPPPGPASATQVEQRQRRQPPPEGKHWGLY